MKINDIIQLYPLNNFRTHWIDYAEGYYLVKISLSDKSMVHFNYVYKNKINRISLIGKWASKIIEDMSSEDNYVTIYSYIIEVDAILMLLYIDCQKIPHEMRIRHHIEGQDSDGSLVEKVHDIKVGKFSHKLIQNKKMKSLTDNKGWLSVLIGSLKYQITIMSIRHSKEIIWNKGFEDRLIQDDKDIEQIIDMMNNHKIRKINKHNLFKGND